jgi:Calx-beta domain
LQISDVRVYEGNSRRSSAFFTISLSQPSNQAVSVNFSTANGSAIAGQDYQALSGSLQFSAGQTQKTIRVRIFGDRLFEADETFSLNLSGANNATIQDGQGLGTILNDDRQRARGSVRNLVQGFGTYQKGVRLGRTLFQSIFGSNPQPLQPVVAPAAAPAIAAVVNGSAAQSSYTNLTANLTNSPSFLARGAKPLAVQSLNSLTGSEFEIDRTSWM